MRNKFWKDKRVFITSYEGFLGSSLTKTLINYSAKIWGLDILTRRKKAILSSEELNKAKILKLTVFAVKKYFMYLFLIDLCQL